MKGEKLEQTLRQESDLVVERTFHHKRVETKYRPTSAAGHSALATKSEYETAPAKPHSRAVIEGEITTTTA